MRNCALIGCVAACYLLAALAPVCSKEVKRKAFNNQTEIQTSDDKKQSYTQQPPIIVNVSPPQKTHDEIEQEAKEHDEKAVNDRKVVEFTGQLANYTLGLFVATGALVIATFGLGFLGLRQGRDMKNSLAIAKESADAAKSTAEIAKQALELSEGAQLSIDTWAIDQFGPDVHPVIQFKIFNSGRTAADMVDAVYKSWIGPSLPPSPPDYSCPSTTTKAVVAATARIQVIPNPLPITQVQYDAIIARESFIYLYGKITYRNIFRKTFELGFGSCPGTGCSWAAAKPLATRALHMAP